MPKLSQCQALKTFESDKFPSFAPSNGANEPAAKKLRAGFDVDGGRCRKG